MVVTPVPVERDTSPPKSQSIVEETPTKKKRAKTYADLWVSRKRKKRKSDFAKSRGESKLSLDQTEDTNAETPGVEPLSKKRRLAAILDSIWDGVEVG